MIEINYLAVLVCAIVAMAIGGFWYSPKGFGTSWMSMTGIRPDQITPEQKKGMWKLYLGQFIASFVMAYVLANIIIAFTGGLGTGVMAGVTGAFWVWLGFIATTTLGTVLWENKPWKLYWINVGHYLVTLVAMGIIFGLWR